LRKRLTRTPDSDHRHERPEGSDDLQLEPLPRSRQVERQLEAHRPVQDPPPIVAEGSQQQREATVEISPVGKRLLAPL
jgi:hypothetical protein